MNEEYNGWPNRETWALHLWLTNEEVLYDAAWHAAKFGADALREWVGTELASMRWLEPVPNSLTQMFDEIGSLWRVDWDRVAQALVEE